MAVPVMRYSVEENAIECVTGIVSEIRKEVVRKRRSTVVTIAGVDKKFSYPDTISKTFDRYLKVGSVTKVCSYKYNIYTGYNWGGISDIELIQGDFGAVSILEDSDRYYLYQLMRKVKFGGMLCVAIVALLVVGRVIDRKKIDDKADNL